MTRAEVKRQMDAGWVDKGIASVCCGFDLNFSHLDHLTESSIVSRRTDGGIPRYRMDEICAYMDQTATELLNKHWPIKKPKATPERQTKRVLSTCEERDEFRRKLDRLNRHVSAWIAAPTSPKLSHRELRLIFQLLTLCRVTNGFEFNIPAAKLQQLTGLDREDLPKARQELERRGILASKRTGATWVYTMLDPATHAPMGDAAGAPTVIAASSWADLEA